MTVTLLAVTMIAFFLSNAIPGDQIERLMSESQLNYQTDRSYADEKREYERLATSLNGHIPTFYFSVQPHVLPDTLHRIIRSEERKVIRHLAIQSNNWEDVHRYRELTDHILLSKWPVLEHSKQPISNALREVRFLVLEDEPQRIRMRIDTAMRHASEIRDESEFKSAIESLQTHTNGWLGDRFQRRLNLPKIVWHGTNNRYHRWLSRVVRGDFGVSNRDARPVFQKIWISLKWTLWLNGLALLVAFGVSIPLGIWMARHPKRKSVKRTQALLFIGYAIPSFWLATILVVFLTTPEYSALLDWFPTQGLGDYRQASNWFHRMSILIYHLFLPVICLAIGALAYISQQMRQSMQQEMGTDYFTTFRSYGMSQTDVIKKHALRNAMYPMITILGGAIPTLFSGSLVIEVIFNIPGIGRLTYQSIVAQDWNVVFGVLIMISVVTMIAYLITDVAYQALDPRVQLGIDKKRHTA